MPTAQPIPIHPPTATRDIVAWLKLLLALRDAPALDDVIALLDLARRDNVSTTELAALLRSTKTGAP